MIQPSCPGAKPIPGTEAHAGSRHGGRRGSCRESGEPAAQPSLWGRHLQLRGGTASCRVYAWDQAPLQVLRTHSRRTHRTHRTLSLGAHFLPRTQTSNDIMSALSREGFKKKKMSWCWVTRGWNCVTLTLGVVGGGRDSLCPTLRVSFSAERIRRVGGLRLGSPWGRCGGVWM